MTMADVTTSLPIGQLCSLHSTRFKIIGPFQHAKHTVRLPMIRAVGPPLCTKTSIPSTRNPQNCRKISKNVGSAYSMEHSYAVLLPALPNGCSGPALCTLLESAFVLL